MDQPTNEPDAMRVQALLRQVRHCNGRFFLRTGAADVPIESAEKCPVVHDWLSGIVTGVSMPASNAPALANRGPDPHSPMPGGERWRIVVVGRRAYLGLGPDDELVSVSGRRSVLDWMIDLAAASGWHGQEASGSLDAVLGGEPRGIPAHFPPRRDDADGDPALAAARDALRDAVRDHDIDRLLAMTAPDICWDLRGRGRNGFRLELIADLDYWERLEEALSHGGIVDDRGRYCAPLFSAWWPAEWIGRGYPYVATSPSTPLYKLPHGASEIIRDVGGEVVTSMNWSAPFTEVTTLDQFVGFVQTSRLSDLLCNGFEVVMERRRGQWRLVWAANPSSW